MVDENYMEPALSNQFHNDLNISPNGLIYTNSKLRLDIGAVSRNQAPLSKFSYSNRRHQSV